VDFVQQTNTTVDTASGLGYVTVTPLPAGTLYTETQSELDVSWVTYSVIVTINGTDFPVNFTAGDTQAAVIEKVPVGASLSANATIGVSAAGGASLGYSSLVAATASPISIQPGENSITMWVQYPLECTVSSDAAGYGAAITGSAPTKYSNASPTALPAATETYTDSDGTTMYFAGWALNDGDDPVISSSIPTGTYKGKLTLWAAYSSCTVSINPGDSWGANTPIIAEGDHLALTAVPAGFPSTPTYTWSIESPSSDAPVTVSSSGVVSPVAGKSGNATVKVTATCGALTATATQNVTVAALSLNCNSTEVLTLDSADKVITASIAGYTGSDLDYTWTIPASPDPDNPVIALTPGETGGTRTFHPAAGGKVTVSVSVRIIGINKTLPAKEVDIYVLELELTSNATSGFSAPTDSTDGSLLLTTADTTGATITATLKGLTSVEVDYSWTPSSSTKMTATGTSTKNLTVTPKTDGTAGTETFTVTATYDGESIQKSVTVTVAGLELTGDSTLVFNSASDAPPTANDITLTLGTVGVNIGDLTGVTYTSSNTLVAANPPTGADGCTVTALKGGLTTITVTATAGGKTFSTTKDITVINLIVTDGDGHEVPETGNSLNSGPMTLTAQLEGITEDVTYDWTCTPASGAAISISSTSGTSTTVSGTSGSASVTLTATYGGTDYTKTMSFCVAYTIAFSTQSALQSFLNNLPATSVSDPAQVMITGLTAENMTAFTTALKNCPSVYVDLSATTLPDDITSLSFYNCKGLIVPPAIPDSVTNMSGCFYGCTNLTDLSELTIPNNVTDMSYCFDRCTGLTDLSELTIPDSVTNMSACFYGCTGLTDLSELTIPDSVTNMKDCFRGCTSLSGTVTINASITSGTSLLDTFKNVDASKITTIYVPDATTKEKLLQKNTQFSDAQVVWPVP